MAAMPTAAIAGKPSKRGTTTTVTPTDFVKVATHPQAAAQSTAMGKTIATLRAWNGKLYSGYGDYGANTGPISVTPFSGSAFAGVPALEAADTEAIWSYRPIGGKLYAPSVDPRVSSDFAVTTGDSGGPSWLNASPVRTTHAFDMVTLTGDDLWLVGSSGHDAVAWRSLDGGSTWKEELRVPPMSTTTGDFARFYAAGVYGGKLYVQAMDFNAGLHPRSKVFDDAGWSEGPTLGSVFTHTEAFSGKLVFHATFHSGNYAARLMAFDGTRSTVVSPSPIYDYTIDADTLYVLSTDGKVLSSRDLTSWTQVGTAPTVARSIGVMNGTIYVGGSDSAIYKK